MTGSETIVFTNDDTAAGQHFTLGTFDAGTRLEFFILQNGTGPLITGDQNATVARSGDTATVSFEDLLPDPTLNAFGLVRDSDFNDVVFQVTTTPAAPPPGGSPNGPTGGPTPPTTLTGTILATDPAGVIGTVDLATGTFQVIGASGAPLTDIDLVSPTSGYAISFTEFYRLDPATGAVTAVGATGSAALNALEVGPDGSVYAAGPDTTGLYAIDAATGAASLLFDTGHASAGDLQFLGATLYEATTDGTLVAIDPAAKSATVVGSFGVPQQLFGLALDGGGQLVGLGAAGGVYAIDTATGQASLLSDTRDINGAATLAAATTPPVQTGPATPPVEADPGVAPPPGTFLGAVIELDLVGPTTDRVGFTLQAPVTASGTEFPLLPRVGIPVGTVVPVQIDITPGNDIGFDFSAAGTSSFTSVPGGFNAYRFIDVNDVLPPITGATIVAGRTTLGVTPDDISVTADSVTINVEGLPFNPATTLDVQVLFA